MIDVETHTAKSFSNKIHDAFDDTERQKAPWGTLSHSERHLRVKKNTMYATEAWWIAV